MTGVLRHIVEHRLNVREGCSSIRQKKRGQAADRNQAIQEEVRKLVEAGIIREVHYHDWLSNPVMVKKHDGSWRMRVDFKDLNKACPKDDIRYPEEAFKQMKQLIAELPMLTAPMEKEELIVYLAATKETVSAVLMTKREAKQMPIYFVNRALRDFIVKRPEEDSPDTSIDKEGELHEPWILFTNGSSCTNGSGAGLILTNPEGMEFTYALRFRFDATNSEAEYEALIVGLRITKQMGVKKLQANVDSRLVAVNETYVAKKADMIRYLEKVLVEELKEKSISEVEILAMVEEEGDTWMTPLFKYLKEGTLPVDMKKARQKLTPITSPWPFYNWEIDIDGPFPKGPWKVILLIVAMNYFTKWIEAKPARCKKQELDIRATSCSMGAPHNDKIKQQRTTEVDLIGNNEALEINLDLLEERREEAAIREATNKAKMEKYYNSKVRNISFKPGDLVYRNNDASQVEDTRKLCPKWEGPYKVTKALGKGAYKLRDRDEKQLSRTWNISNLKKCHIHKM
nr:reverse transcriptase domain-containing protein [Tanacetum cinerariifolium]